MGSIVREVRERQKAEASAAVEKRVAQLKAAGVDDKKAQNDVYLRHAKAELRKALNRIRAIDSREAVAAEAAQRKAEGRTDNKITKAAKTETKPKAEGKKSKEKKA